MEKVEKFDVWAEGGVEVDGDGGGKPVVGEAKADE